MTQRDESDSPHPGSYEGGFPPRAGYYAATWGECWACGHRIPIRADGTLWRHRRSVWRWIAGTAARVEVEDGELCPGSLVEPAFPGQLDLLSPSEGRSSPGTSTGG